MLFLVYQRLDLLSKAVYYSSFFEKKKLLFITNELITF